MTLYGFLPSEPPDKIAIVDDQSDRSLTYKELIEEIDVIAAGLKNRGVKKGMRIATILPSLFEHAIVLLALQRLSAIPALINFRLASQDIGQLIKLGNIKGAIILPDKQLAKIVIENVGSTDRVLCIGKAMGKSKKLCGLSGG